MLFHLRFAPVVFIKDIFPGLRIQTTKPLKHLLPAQFILLLGFIETTTFALFNLQGCATVSFVSEAIFHH
jgi:hypothetical protein